MIIDANFTPANTLEEANARLAKIEQEYFMSEAKYFKTEALRWVDKTPKDIVALLEQLMLRYVANLRSLKQKHHSFDKIPIEARRKLARDYRDWSEDFYYEVAGHSKKYGVVDPYGGNLT